MQLYIKSSNSLNLLVDELVGKITSPRTHSDIPDEINNPDLSQRPSDQAPDIFTPFCIVTQTDGMKSWLKIQIAEKTGIAANLSFLKPNELINKIYSSTGGQYENTLAISDIQWLIYQSLANPEITRTYPELASYYTAHGTLDNVKRIAFSQKLADLFDQYQIYRAEMLKIWESGKSSTDAGEEKWQRDIWNMIRKKAGDQFPDKSRIKETIIKNLSQPENIARLKRALPEVSFFGTSLVTSFHYEILEAVSQHIPVTFYLPNPAPHLYWYEDKSKKALFYERRRGVKTDETLITNPLLINWGRLIQNTFQLLFGFDEAINQYEEKVLPPEGHSLLSSVQLLIHENTTLKKESLFVDEQLQDGSITIRSCYSVVREVESLYNYLIRLIDGNPGKYSPRDIVVHVTDINRYASYIRSVFDYAPYPLKYTIADESFTEADTISQALYEILTMEERDFTSEKVVQLINFSSVRKHFGITDVGAIRKIVAEANIRHGITGETENESLYVSWEYGLKRIMYGICISSEEEYEPGPTGYYPLDTIESNDANEMIHFVYMAENLIKLIRSRTEDRPVAQWIDYLQEVIRLLIFDEEERDNIEYQQLTEHINSLAVEQKLFDEKVSYPVFLRQFLPGLNEMSKSYRFAKGGITFCSLIPMRSIPFKIVAMLGLDFDKFPRKPIQSGFDLMNKYQRPGDRNIKINDKHLFLETLMSAEERLYLSYTGQRINDNFKLPPSILVDELISFIESSSVNPGNVRKHLLLREPLHNFSPKYGNEPGYYNYLLDPADALSLDKEATKTIQKNKDIDLDRLFNFLSDGLKWYYRNTVGIYYDEESVALPETESFSMDNLEKWGLKNELLITAEDQIEDFINHQKKTGNIPLKRAGEYEVASAAEEIRQIKKQFDEEVNGYQVSTKNIEITDEDYHITASINFIFDTKIIVPCFSKDPNKYYLKAWLYTLVTSAANKKYHVVFIGEDKKNAEKISQPAALSMLRKLISLMEKGEHQIPFFNIKWYGASRQPDEKKFVETLEKDASNDRYLSLALKDGIPDDAFGRYKEVADTVFPAIRQTFNLGEAR